MPSRREPRRRFRSTSSSKPAPSLSTSRTSSSGDPGARKPDMRVVFVDPGGRSGALVEERLDHTTERHLVALSPPPLAPGDPISALAADASLGLVVALAGGCPNRAELKLLKRGLALQRRVWLHWP